MGLRVEGVGVQGLGYRGHEAVAIGLDHAQHSPHLALPAVSRNMNI